MNEPEELFDLADEERDEIPAPDPRDDPARDHYLLKIGEGCYRRMPYPSGD